MTMCPERAADLKLTVDALAVFYDTSVSAVWKWIYRGKIKPAGRAYRMHDGRLLNTYRFGDIEEYLNPAH